MSKSVYAELRSVGFDSTYESGLRFLEWYCDRVAGDIPRVAVESCFPSVSLLTFLVSQKVAAYRADTVGDDRRGEAARRAWCGHGRYCRSEASVGADTRERLLLSPSRSYTALCCALPTLRIDV